MHAENTEDGNDCSSEKYIGRKKFSFKINV